MRKSKGYILVCLECADEYKSKTDYTPCPKCGGVGELSVANYKDSSSHDEDDDFSEDVNLGDLVYDPNY